MNPIGLNMTEVKRKNRASILKYINKMGAISRKDIALYTGLTPASVTQLCQELLEEGMIFETGEKTGNVGAGRKKILMDLNWEYAYVLGVQIETEETVVVLSTANGCKLELETVKTEINNAPETFLKKVGEICCKMRDRHPEVAKRIDAVSITVAGQVDNEEGTWNDVPVREILQKVIDIPVVIENNVDAFAMAENLFGQGRKYEDILIVKWGPGLGASIISGGFIFESKAGRPGEMGKLIVGDDLLLEDCVCESALKKADSKDKEIAIEALARAVVNAISMLASQKVVVCGSLGDDEKYRQNLADKCAALSGDFPSEMIQPTLILEMENYIGPLASYIYKKLL